MDEQISDAYATALGFLLSGALPVVFDLDDGLHVLAVIPMDQPTYDRMFSPDVRVRMQLVINTACKLKKSCEESMANG